MNERLRAIDLGLLANLAGLLLLLWLALYSATQFGSAGEAPKQLLFMLIGGIGAFFVTLTPYRYFQRLTMPFFLVTVLALVAVLVMGESVNGAQRWLSLGPLGTFQPSEVAKLTVVLVSAAVLAEGLSPERLALWGGAIGGLFLMILVQPDLGTSLVVAAVGGAVLYVAGFNATALFATFGLGVSALPYVLKEYQRDRLMVFVNPDIDPNGMGYSLVQSQTAIGSGGLWGKGLLHGHLTQQGFVPENWTDFLFSVVGEEFGFVGSVGLLFMYGLLTVQIVFVGLRAKDRYGLLLCAGIAAMLAVQVFVNIGMTCGLAPVVGLPLPFGSFGGTAMVTNLLAMGVVGSVSVESRLPETPLSDRRRPSHQEFRLVSVIRRLAS